ncbi:hypothetical protein CLU79DRAFT_733141 [Phycomyces nitens]|nr:hypothetical protein CLU79DRAFT_733141 [Phycomyces nitens]
MKSPLQDSQSNGSTGSSARTTRVTKPTPVKKTFRVALKSHSSSPADIPKNHPSVHHDVSPLAAKLRQRLSAAMATLAVPSPTHVTSPHAKPSFPHASPSPAHLSPADWPNPPRLRNLRLLKDYLALVAMEGYQVDMEPDAIQITVSDQSHAMSTHQAIGHQGAVWIEALVHAPSEMESQLKPTHKEPLPFTVSRGLDRRRPGRPSKLKCVLYDQELGPVKKPDERLRTKRHQRPTRKALDWTEELKRKKKPATEPSLVQCICNTPHEEFGSMVQCDDCSSWLHVDCLALNGTELEETFRCPSCYMSLGAGKTAKLLSAVTWRYVAQWKSRRLAAAMHCDSGSDDDDDMPNRPKTNEAHPSLSLSTLLPPALVPDRLAISPECPVSSPAHSEDTESPSEASTPDHGYGFDCFDTEDPHNVGYFGHGYFGQADPIKEDLLGALASDVFLCENIDNAMSPVSPTTMDFAPDIPPSYICSQYLSEMSTIEDL